MAFMLCLSINYRAFSELSREVDENQNLSWQIQNLTTENLDLQEEIHNLKNDPAAIMREAQKMGIASRQNQVPVQANK
jgi:cell division protein FtsB